MLMEKTSDFVCLVFLTLSKEDHLFLEGRNRAPHFCLCPRRSVQAYTQSAPNALLAANSAATHKKASFLRDSFSGSSSSASWLDDEWGSALWEGE